MADAALAAVASYEQSGMRFRWGVPSSSDAGLYFSIDAPATHTWAGLGIGEGMRDSTMFLVYADGDGNVTLSTRRGAGYSMPQHMDIAGTELVAGSGVRDGRMVANVRCAGACASGLDLDGGNSWFTAWKAGAGAMDTSNVEAPIQFHDGARVFDVDLSQASIASDANPFVDSSASGGDDNNSAVSSSGGGGGERQTLASAHGVVMSVAFLVLYPIGAMLMPLLGKWLAHGLMQLVAYLTMWAGFGIGIYLSKNGPPVSGPWEARSNVCREGDRHILTPATALLRLAQGPGHHPRRAAGPPARHRMAAPPPFRQAPEARHH